MDLSYLEACDEVCRFQKSQLADLVDNCSDLGAGLGRVEPPGDERAWGADRGAAELAGAPLRGVSAREGHGVYV